MDSTSDPKENIDFFFPPQIYKLCLVLFTAISITFRKRALYRSALDEQVSPYQVNMQLGKSPFKQHWPPKRSCISHQAGSWHLQIIFFNYFAALSSNYQHFLSCLLKDVSWPHSQRHHGEMSRRWGDSTHQLLWKWDFHVPSETANKPKWAGQFFSQVWPFQVPDLS